MVLLLVSFATNPKRPTLKGAISWQNASVSVFAVSSVRSFMVELDLLHVPALGENVTASALNREALAVVRSNRKDTIFVPRDPFFADKAKGMRAGGGGAARSLAFDLKPATP